MKIKTELLQQMINKSIKGAGNNSMIPITELIGLDVNGDTLTLITTDGSNQLRVIEKVDYDPVFGPNIFYTIVNADKFSKLVGKMTSEFIELTNNNNYLEIRGNGIYKLDISAGEDGNLIKFPEIQKIEKEPEVISANLLKNILNTAKSSVGNIEDVKIPFLTGYYISEKSITTNRNMVCLIANGIKENILISGEMAELLSLIDTDEVNMYKEDNRIIFTTSNMIISGKELEGKESYPVKPIENLVALNYSNSVKLNKQELLNVLERIKLFVSSNDKNSAYLTFLANSLLIKSKSSDAEETIDYAEIVDNENDFTCLVDINMLKAQVETVSTDIIDLYYGQDKSIKIVDGNCSLVISLEEKAG